MIREWPLHCRFLECRVKPLLQCQPDQCCDQDCGVKLSNERFCYGQRSRYAIDRTRVAVGYGRQCFKAEVNQSGRFTC